MSQERISVRWFNVLWSNILSRNEKHPNRKNGFIVVYAEEVKKNNILQEEETSTDGIPNDIEALKQAFMEAPKEILKAEEMVRLEFKGTKLDKKDLLGKSGIYLFCKYWKSSNTDPYFKLYRTRQPGGSVEDSILVYTSEILKNTLDPAWKSFEISKQELCNNDEDRELIFICFDWDRA